MFIAEPNSSTRQHAIQTARQAILQKPVYLDTETTGLDRNDEIVEISIIDEDGKVLLESFVKPTQPIPADVIQVHGITNEMVQKAPSWPVLWMRVRSVLFGRLLAIYNADFDLRMMQQTHARHRIPWKDTFKSIDIMKLYSDYRGEWDSVRRSMRYHSLDSAGRYFKISIPNSHRATDDTLLARAVLHSIADTKTIGEPT
ncbi:MAG TPA: 3'-5' exonuclease [Anaerolineaceae bacterium]|nr:3'-5' exonuclease [Anaerolineaceae bacterium]